MIKNDKPPGDAEESDDYLIELMGLKDDFPDEALDAYGKIYVRYWQPMLRIAQGVAKDNDMAKDLLSDTFHMVYHKASTFRKGGIRNPANIRLSIAKWITTIMQRIFYDHYRDENWDRTDPDKSLEDTYIIENVKIVKYIDNDFDDFIELLKQNELNVTKPEIIQHENGDESENLRKVRHYLSKLPQREQDIILTTYNYYQPGKYCPAEVLNVLERRWGTTRENIRKILQKFRSSIKENLQSQIFIRK